MKIFLLIKIDVNKCLCRDENDDIYIATRVSDTSLSWDVVPLNLNKVGSLLSAEDTVRVNIDVFGNVLEVQDA